MTSDLRVMIYGRFCKESTFFIYASVDVVKYVFFVFLQI